MPEDPPRTIDWPSAASARADRRLEQALLFTLACHGVAMLSMAALLLPMMPGGVTHDDAARVALLAAHPLRFRLGWVPWHVTAASDLLLALALVRARWIARGPAWLAFGLTLVSVALDQGGQLMWLTRGMALVHETQQTGDIGPYLRYETWVMPITSGWAALGYTLTALAWTWCFRKAGTWSRVLSFLSVPLWSVFLIVSVAPLLPPTARPAPELIAAGNAVGFVLMEVWFVLVSERVLARARPDAPHGRWAVWRHPHRGLVGRAITVVANSRWVRSIGELFPLLEMGSDITDVVYVNYLVPASRLVSQVPEGLELQRLGPEGRYALFTFLTYRHHRFGPTLFGARRLFPSPVQSNWRTYVRDPRTGTTGIYFVTTAITTTLHAIAARELADGTPMHLLAKGELARTADGVVTMTLDPGQGTAPDARAALHPTQDRSLPAPWSECFESYEAMLAYDVPQDRAMATLPWRRRTVRLEIALGIPIDSVEPLAGEVESAAARAIVGDARPLSFRVPAVPFRLKAEAADDWE